MARESQFVDYEQGAAEDLALMSSDSEVSRPGGSRRRLAAAGLLGTALLLGLVAIVARSPAPSRGVRHGVVVTLDQVPTPAKCVANGEDCGHVGCCSEAGMQCYKKNDYWASCNATCSSEPDANGEVWDCDAIGTRASPAGKGGGAPAAAPAQCIADVPLRKLAGAAPKNSTGAAVAKPKAQPEGNPCSWEGENCIESKCCRRQGFKCYMKSEGTGWAGCNAECTPGPHPEWGDDDPWSCDVLGESYQLPHIEAAPAAEAAGTSLFCFVVYTPDGVVRPGTGKSIQSGYEKTLVESMKTNGVGIYECDAAATFLGQRVPEGDW